MTFYRNRNRNLIALFTVTAAVLSAASAAGCSDSVEQASGESGGASSSASISSTSASSSATGAGGQGSATGAGGQGGATGAGGGGAGAPSCGPADDLVLAMDTLLLGDKNPNGVPNKANGWKQYGFNIDGLVSTATSKDLCQPISGANPNSTYPDGNNGNDNSFGKNVLPILLAINSDFSTAVNERFESGDYTILLRLMGLGSGPDSSLKTTKLYRGAALGMPPKLDGSDCWPAAPEGLTDPADIDAASVLYDQSSIAMGTWSSGGVAAIVLELSQAGYSMKLTIHNARLSMVVDPSHSGAEAGQIGGVIDTEELAAEFKKVAAAFDASFCEGNPTIDSILNQIRQASDILKDGTQDPAKSCDGISIGLGFTMKRAGLESIAPPSPPPVDPCAP